MKPEEIKQARNTEPRSRLSAAQRVRDTKDFQRVYSGRQKVHTSHVIVCYSPNERSFSRLGVSVGVKHGNAVQRNRIKRIFRAAFRAAFPAKGIEQLPAGFDYVLIPQKGAAERSSAEVLKCLVEAGKKIRSRPVRKNNN